MDERETFGLFTMIERCSLMGGVVKIQSAPGQGTRIRLTAPATLPREQPGAAAPAPRELAAAAGQEPHAGEKRGRAIRVLLADDHRVLRDGLVSLLREEPGIEVVGDAADGQVAVELARRHRPDIVVMDITMPRMNGIEATRILSEELRATKVIAMSMHETEEMEAAMREAGAVSYVTKGGPAEQLVREIRRVAAMRVDGHAPV